MNNSAILDDFFKQLVNCQQQLNSLYLQSNLQAQYFEECGQIADRLFGAASMLSLDEIAKYLKTMKTVFYKCSHSENETAQQKTHELVGTLIQIIEYISSNINQPDELKKIYFKMGLAVKRGEKLLNSYFFSIKEGSADYLDDQNYIYVFDRNCRLEMMVNESKKIYYPSYVFFNAHQGFLKQIRQNSSHIAGLVVDTDCSSNIWMEILRESQQIIPGVPVMLLAKSTKGLGSLDRASLGVRIIASATIGPDEIIEKMKNQRVELPLAELPPNVLQSNDDAFLQISRSAFTLNTISPYDLYIKLNGHYVKLSEQGEDVTEEQLQRPDVLLFILKEQHDAYLKEFEQTIAQMLSDNSVESDLKKIYFDEFCSEIYTSMKDLGACEESLNCAKKMLEHSAPLIESMRIKSRKVNKLFFDLKGFSHSVSVSLIVGLLLQEIGADKSIYDDIFLTALIHDIGLIDASEHAKSENLLMMNAEDQKIFFEHPLKGELMAREMGVKNVLCEAIAQHHRRLDGSGFPEIAKGKAIVINRIGELIGLAEEFCHMIEDSDGTNKSPADELRLRLDGRFSTSIRRAFDVIFPPDFAEFN